MSLEFLSKSPKIKNVSTFLIPVSVIFLTLLGLPAKSDQNPFTPLLTDQPYWRTQRPLYQRVIEERWVPVSVKRKTLENLSPPTEQWQFRGGGLVKVPKDYAWKKSRQVEKLTLVDRYFKRVTYDPQKQWLYIHLLVMGVEREMTVELHWIEDPIPALTWVNRDGWYKGLHGVLKFERYDEQNTLIELAATYETPPSNLNWLTSFLAEALMQPIAISLRRVLEEQHKSERASLPL